MQSLSMDLWKSVEDGYEFPKVAEELEENGGATEVSTTKMVTVDPENRKKSEWNTWEKKVILCELVYDEFTKVMHCIIVK